MQTLELDIANYQSPGDVIRFLDEHDIKRGDTLKVTTEQEQKTMAMIVVIVVVIALVYFFRQQRNREEDGEIILETLFKEGTTVEEIEKQVEAEYGIKIDVETKRSEEREFWYKLSEQSLSRAYSIDEPDYSDVDLKEPNPNYKGWKKDK
jgi:preprotein translocase subunit YajC